MRSIKKHLIIMCSLLAGMMAGDICSAQRPVVGPFANSAQIESMPMLSRPNRIGHVYGNTMRRRYDRSQSTITFIGAQRTPMVVNRLPIRRAFGR